MIVSVLAAPQGKRKWRSATPSAPLRPNRLILAVAMIFMPIAIRRRDYVKHCGLLIAAAAVLLGFSLSGSLSLAGAVILIAIFLISMAENVRNAMKRRGRQRSDSDDAEGNWPPDRHVPAGRAGHCRRFAPVGQQRRCAGGFLRRSERIVAVTMIAIGTSLPELVTTITAIVKKESSFVDRQPHRREHP